LFPFALIWLFTNKSLKLTAN